MGEKFSLREKKFHDGWKVLRWEKVQGGRKFSEWEKNLTTGEKVLKWGKSFIKEQKKNKILHHCH